MFALGQLRPVGGVNSLVVADKKKGDLVPQMMGVKGLVARPAGQVLHIKRRSIEIEGEVVHADPTDLITVIRSITQEIGDWKKLDNLMSKYKVVALRSARQAAVSDLKKFGIHWEIEKSTGESIFYM